MIDNAPEIALGIALPIAVPLVRDKYGVDLEYAVTEVPPDKGGSAKGRFGAGVYTGVGIAAAAWALWHFGISRLMPLLPSL